MKFVRQYFKQTGHPGKYKFVSRYHGYHGGTFGAMAASGNGPRKSKFEPQMAGFLKVFPPTHYRDRFSWDEANRFAAQSVEDVILHEAPDTVAGVIVEPIGNTGGIITPTPEYFRILRDICDRHNVLLIFDEVITGFAKTGSMFAAQTLRRDARHPLRRQGHLERRHSLGRDDRARGHGGGVSRAAPG